MTEERSGVAGSGEPHVFRVRDVTTGKITEIDTTAKLILSWRKLPQRLHLGGGALPPLLSVLPLVAELGLLDIDELSVLTAVSRSTRLLLLLPEPWEHTRWVQTWLAWQCQPGVAPAPRPVVRCVRNLQAGLRGLSLAWYNIDAHYGLSGLDFNGPAAPETLRVLEETWLEGSAVPTSFRASVMLRDGQPTGTPPGRTIYGARLLSLQEVIGWLEAVRRGIAHAPSDCGVVVAEYLRRQAEESASSGPAPASAGAGRSSAVTELAMLARTAATGAVRSVEALPISAPFGSKQLFLHVPTGVVLNMQGLSSIAVAPNFYAFLVTATR